LFVHHPSAGRRRERERVSFSCRPRGRRDSPWHAARRAHGGQEEKCIYLCMRRKWEAKKGNMVGASDETGVHVFEEILALSHEGAMSENFDPTAEVSSRIDEGTRVTLH